MFRGVFTGRWNPLPIGNKPHRIESYPAKDRMWEYLFFADFLGHIEQPEIAQCLEEIKGKTTFFKFLGSYPRGGQS